MNKLLNHIIEERKGHYCHDIEVRDTLEIESIIESAIDAYNPHNQDNFTDIEFIEFFESITVHYLGEDDKEEQKCYAFDFNEYIKGTI